MSTRFLWILVVAAIALLEGCMPWPVGLTNASRSVSLVLQPQLVEGRYTQALVSNKTAADIARLDIIPYVLTPSGEFRPISRSTGQPTDPSDSDRVRVSQTAPLNLSKPVILTNLHPNTTYRIFAQAYDASGLLISTTDTGSYVQVQLGSDDRPQIPTSLPIRLIDTPFNGRTTVTLSATGSTAYDSIDTALYAVIGGSEVAVAGATASLPRSGTPGVVALSNLHANTLYRLKAVPRVTGAGPAPVTGSVSLPVVNDDRPASAAVTVVVPTYDGSSFTYGNLTLSDTQLWQARSVIVTGVLRITTGGSLTLDGGQLQFSPLLEDGSTFAMDGNGRFVGRNATLTTASGKQWNLNAYGTSQFQATNMTITRHSGLRFYNSSTMEAWGGNVEEVQVHDNAAVTMHRGVSTYLVLFFTGTGTSRLTQGELTTGSGLSRAFTIATGPTTTGRVTLDGASVVGYQLDLNDSVSVQVQNATNMVLALHLSNVSQTFAADLTSPSLASGSVDFSAQGGPTFAFADSKVWSLNLYLSGNCQMTFNGATRFTEPNVSDTSVLTLGASTSLDANLAQTYDSGQMILNGTRLLEEGGVFPSLTAMGSSSIRMTGVDATPNTRVYANGQGQVVINGGRNWNAATMFQNIDTQPPGGITLSP
jgi:hypothetical protein